MEMGLICGEFTLFKKDLPNDIVGEIMLDIAFINPNNCRDKEAWLGALESTAKEII